MGAEPEGSPPILDQFQVGQAPVLGAEIVCREALRHRVKTTKPALGAGPQCSAVVDEQTRDNVVAQSVWVRRIMAIRLELPCSPIEAKEPVSKTANPEIA